MIRLDEFTEEEWWDICSSLTPGLTREQYETMWNNFQDTKRMKELN